MSSYDDDLDFDFFEDPQPEAPQRQRRVRRGPREPRRPTRPPTGAVALARLVGLVALGIAVVVGFVFWVGACQGQSKHDEYASYLGDVRVIAQGSARVGTELSSKLQSPGLKLADLETSLEQWSQQEQQAYDQAQQLRAPGPLQADHQQVLDTLQLRALGLAGIAAALTQTSNKDSATAATALAAQAQLLTASDIVWAELYKLPVTDTLKQLGITGVVVPASQFVTNPDIISARSFQIVYQRLKPASTGGTPSGLHGTTLLSTAAVAGTKTATLSPTNPTTIYDSADLQLRATIQDSGNFPEGPVPVTLTVSVGTTKVLTKTANITTIAPGQQASASFGNLQLPPTAFGHQASVTIDVGKVAGEQNVTNNTATYPVFFSLSQG
ncbi:MAG: hypothetical protein JOZ56_09405 [Actinobacteria bacterium]|nr:hypothetical protein [Actinomycetota bacterium]MBV8563292.1 hypothetical protein [Actinomycetota bacterium]